MFAHVKAGVGISRVQEREVLGLVVGFLED